MPHIATIETVLPPNFYSNDEVMPFYRRIYEDLRPALKKKAEQIFLHAGIEEKHTVIPVEELFTERTFEESNNVFREKSVLYATEVLDKALKSAGLNPSDINLVISTSCTGYMIPSFDTFALNNLGFPESTKQMPVTEMGCAAGVSSLIYAFDYLKAYPKHRVAIINLELPSNTIQLKDISFDNLVSTAIFGDGIACTILEGDEIGKSSSPYIAAAEMRRIPDTMGLLGYNISNSGLKMTLDKTVPDVIKANYINSVTSFLNNNGKDIKEVNNFLVHPGGLKILDYIDELLEPLNKDVSTSRNIMKRYGNLSSATIMFILKEFLKGNHGKETVHVSSFGPGFNIHQVLLNIGE